MEENNVIVWTNKTYIQEQRFDSEGRNYLYGSPIYFDVNLDTSKSSSVEVSDSPIDARNGATLSDKRIVNMKTIGISGKYSSRNTNNSSFKVVENRLGIIIDYFEDALNKQRIYTVCRKGSIYPNMMLNKVNLKFDEHCSTVSISLSFIEVIIIGVDTELQSKIITREEVVENIVDNIQEFFDSEQEDTGENYIKLIAPKLTYQWKQEGYNNLDYNLYLMIENNNYTDYYNGAGDIIGLNGGFDAKISYRTMSYYDGTVHYGDTILYKTWSLMNYWSKSRQTEIRAIKEINNFINSGYYRDNSTWKEHNYQVLSIVIEGYFWYKRYGNTYTQGYAVVFNSEGEPVKVKDSNKTILNVDNLPQIEK